jgi:hypothetical protein
MSTYSCVKEVRVLHSFIGQNPAHADIHQAPAGGQYKHIRTSNSSVDKHVCPALKPNACQLIAIYITNLWCTGVGLAL